MEPSTSAPSLPDAVPLRLRGGGAGGGSGAGKRSRDAAGADTSERKNKKEKKSKKEGKESKKNRKDKDRENKGDEKRKGKKAEAPHAIASTDGYNTAGLARVGDASLAAAGPPLVKALYTEHPAVAGTSDAEAQRQRDAVRGTVDGTSLKPVVDFAHCGFSADLLKATASFARPSPIQSLAWPAVLSGRDVVGVAATGSGKTLAFGLPALAHIAANRAAGSYTGGNGKSGKGGPAKGPFCLVLSPTRELAIQITDVLAGASRPDGCVCVYGGVPKREQREALRRGTDVVVATPGRLQDLMEENSLTLSKVSFLVLDEADRMLDLGFAPEIKKIASATRSDRQTLMFSATWPRDVQELANDYLCSPVKVTVGSTDLAANHAVTQRVEVIDPEARGRRLERLLEELHGGSKNRKNRVMVFVLYKKEAVRVESYLRQRGWKAAAVHGDASQAERTRAVDGFRSGECPLLIATDVAARGLDIPDVEAVINYSFPLTIEDYVHRIGRTGRAGKTGVSHTFFQAVADKARAGELVNVLREAGQAVPGELLKFGTHVKKKESKLYGAHFKDVDTSVKATKKTFDSDSE